MRQQAKTELSLHFACYFSNSVVSVEFILD